MAQAALDARPARRRPIPIAPYVYLAPTIIALVVFTIFPSLYTIYISFTNYSLFHFKSFDFIGLENYQEILSQGSAFLPVLSWTVVWTLLTTGLNIGVGLVLAMLLNIEGLRERNLYRTLLIIPWALPFILTVQMWAGLLNVNGVVNQILNLFGVAPIKWLGEIGGSVFYPRFAVLMVNLWLSYPFFMTVNLAALQSIPRDMYEAADLDGATSTQRFRYITFPWLMAAIMPLLITQLSFQFNNFGVIYLLTGGNPLAFPGATYGVTDNLATFAYKLIQDQRRYGLAAAYGMIIFVLISVFTVINSRVTGAFEEVD